MDSPDSSLLFYFIIAFIMGIITMSIGISKGRSKLGFFLLGFFFSLIGIIIALVIKDKREEERSNTIIHQNFCTNCGKKLKIKLNYCTNCGHKLIN